VATALGQAGRRPEQAARRLAGDSAVARSARRSVVLAAAVAAFASCAAPPAPPDIVLVSLDNLRRDHVGLYCGGRASLTPEIDALAPEAVVFDDAWAPVPFTLPSHISMFTGLYPDVHGVDRSTARLADTLPTLPEQLKAAGYHTIGVASNLWMQGEFGFARGFDHYEVLEYGLVYADRVNRRAFELLDALDSDVRPLFLFLHYIDPHCDHFKAGENALPYYAPPRFLEGLGVSAGSTDFCDEADHCASEFLAAADRELRPVDRETVSRIAALYGRGVAYVDREIGALVDGLRSRSRWDDSLVLITSDHGEEFREHGRFLHVQPYVEDLAVPLLVKLPRARRGGARVETTVETVDYLPTLLEAAGEPPPSHLQGKSLLPLVRGEVAPEARAAFGRDKLDRQCFTLRLGQWTLIHHRDTGSSELYDRLDDPTEQRDVAAQQIERVEAMRTALLRIVRANRKLKSTIAAEPVRGDILSDDDAEKLRAIGYVE